MYREPAQRINIAGGVLVLPVVVYYGVPVILSSVCQLHPVVLPQVSHLRQVPFLTSVKLPHSPQASPS